MNIIKNKSNTFHYRKERNWSKLCGLFCSLSLGAEMSNDYKFCFSCFKVSRLLFVLKRFQNFGIRLDWTITIRFLFFVWNQEIFNGEEYFTDSGKNLYHVDCAQCYNAPLCQQNKNSPNVTSQVCYFDSKWYCVTCYENMQSSRSCFVCSQILTG